MINYVTSILAKIEDEDFGLDEEIDETSLMNSIVKEEFDLNYTIEDGIYVAYGKRIDNLLSKVNMEDYDSRICFETTLRDMGVFDKFKEMGAQEGDTVAIGDLVFEYYE